MSDKKRLAFAFLGLVFSVVPTMLAVLSYFPVWRERGGGAMLSGFTLCLILIAALPAVRLLKKVFESPSAPMIWLAAFIIFSALSRIAREMTVISFVGFTSNLIGAYFFTRARKADKENENQA